MWETTTEKQAPLSVTDALLRAKSALEAVSVTLIGEVSEFNDKPGYKAAYFTVADKNSSLPCLMWRTQYVASGIELKTGMLVELQGRFSAYPAKGRMQFSVSSLKLAGEGDLRQKVAALARKLQAEGLMDPARKKPVDSFCETVCVITSPRGKAVHDVLRTLRRRNPLVHIKFFGVGVEGPTAVDQIITALQLADQQAAQALLLVRGGGSYEDLMPFNDERLARTIAALKTPVVTGIGHEPDNSICDMVADKRCSTPTAAAEAIAPSVEELYALTKTQTTRLAHGLSTKLERARTQLAHLISRPVFSNPHTLFARFNDEVLLAHDRLLRAIPEALLRDQMRYSTLVDKLVGSIPHVFGAYTQQLGVQAAKLHALSPLNVLERGYALATTPDGRIVKEVSQVVPHEKLSVQLKDGVLDVTVDAIAQKDVTKSSKP